MVSTLLLGSIAYEYSSTVKYLFSLFNMWYSVKSFTINQRILLAQI